MNAPRSCGILDIDITISAAGADANGTKRDSPARSPTHSRAFRRRSGQMVVSAGDLDVIWSAAARRRFALSRSDAVTPFAVHLEIGRSLLFGWILIRSPSAVEAPQGPTYGSPVPVRAGLSFRGPAALETTEAESEDACGLAIPPRDHRNASETAKLCIGMSHWHAIGRFLVYPYRHASR